MGEKKEFDGVSISFDLLTPFLFYLKEEEVWKH